MADLPVIAADLAIDVVHTHHTWVDLTVADLLSGVDGVRHVLTSHGRYDALSEADLHDLGTRLARTVAEATYVADGNRAALVTLGMDATRLTKIPNAIDRVVVSGIDRTELGVPLDAFVLCIASRAIREKGWQEAIEAVELAQAGTARPIHLLICGDGEELHRLEPRWAAERIHFLGFRAQPADVYATSDLGILPSFYPGESQPLTLIECLAAGKPFLATDVGEIGRMLETTRGMAGSVVPLRDGRPDVSLLAEGILAYIRDPELHREHTAIAREAYRAFSPEAMVRAYEAVYARAMGGSSAGKPSR